MPRHLYTLQEYYIAYTYTKLYIPKQTQIGYISIRIINKAQSQTKNTEYNVKRENWETFNLMAAMNL